MLKLLVIKTEQLHELKAQYEVLGLKFEYHQHGKSPFHYSAKLGDLIFEIYPLNTSKIVANSTRLGFSISQLN